MHILHGMGKDRRPVPLVADPATSTIRVIDGEHHEVHNGDHFFVKSAVDLASGEVYDVQFTTPDTTRWTHFAFLMNCESEVDWYIYEGATINTPGTPMTPINNNRNSTKTSVNTVAGIENSSVENANADTAVAEATQLMYGKAGSGKDAGIVERAWEIILKQNTVYCLRAVAAAAGYISFDMEWYEHTNHETLDLS